MADILGDMDDATGKDELDDVIDAAETYSQTLEHAIDVEECGFCEQVLMAAQALPLEDQIGTLRELQRYEELMLQEEVPDADEIQAVTDDFQYLDI